MADDTRGYRAYLVRFWNAGSPGAPRWRASVQDVRTGERRGFPDLAALWAFLVAQLGTSIEGGAAVDTPGDDRESE